MLKRPAINGKSKNVLTTGVAAHTYEIAFTARIAVQIIAGSVWSLLVLLFLNDDACSNTQRSDGSPSMVTLQVRRVNHSIHLSRDAA